MNIVILGATGGTGRETMEQALARGHRVTVVVRSPRKVAARHERLTVVGASPVDPEALRSVLPGHDAVVTSLGPNGVGPTTIYSDAALALLSSVRPRGPRVVAVTAALHFPLHSWAWAFFRLVARHAVRDGKRLEDALRRSELDWTIVRPPRLTDKPPVGSVRALADALPPRGGVITRADLGRFLVDELETPRFRGTIVGVAN